MKRVFEFDGIDQVLAVSKEVAKEYYFTEFAYDDLEIEQMEIKEIPESEWESRTVLTDEEEDGEYIKFTLKEWVEQFDENTPQIIASTEF